MSRQSQSGAVAVRSSSSQSQSEVEVGEGTDTADWLVIGPIPPSHVPWKTKAPDFNSPVSLTNLLAELVVQSGLDTEGGITSHCHAGQRFTHKEIHHIH